MVGGGNGHAIGSGFVCEVLDGALYVGIGSFGFLGVDGGGIAVFYDIFVAVADFVGIEDDDDVDILEALIIGDHSY